MRFCSFLTRALLSIAVLGACPTRAQSHLVEGPGPYASLDVAGGPFPMITPAGVDVSGGLGYRLGHGLDVALLVGRAGAVADTLFPYPPEWHLGTELGATLGRRWRLAVAANVSIAEADTFAFPAVPGSSRFGPTEVRGESTVIERRARATVTRYVPLVEGRLRVLAGVGLFGAVRRVTGSTLLFGAGGPDERAVGGETVTETTAGVVVAAPVTLRLRHGPTLVLDPEVRLSPLSPVFGIGDGQLTLRVNL